MIENITKMFTMFCRKFEIFQTIVKMVQHFLKCFNNISKELLKCFDNCPSCEIILAKNEMCC